MFDYFVAELRCPRCGAISAPTSVTNMQTHIRGAGASGAELGVDFLFKSVYLTSERLVGAGYALIAAPSGGQVRLLDVWTCPSCETEEWAMIEITEGRIERIEAVVLDRATFESANFIDSTSAEHLAARLLGIPSNEFSVRKLSSIEILRQRLE